MGTAATIRAPARTAIKRFFDAIHRRELGADRCAGMFLAGISIVDFADAPQHTSDRHRKQLQLRLGPLRLSTDRTGGQQLVAQSFAVQKLCGISVFDGSLATASARLKARRFATLQKQLSSWHVSGVYHRPPGRSVTPFL
jgi:hypothetical protein